MAEMGEPEKLVGLRASVREKENGEGSPIADTEEMPFSSSLEMGWTEILLFSYTRLRSTEK